MIGLVLAAVTAVHNFASTPQDAGLRAVYSRADTSPVVQRINAVGRYATVLTSGGMLEGSPITSPILVERFSFGWQALDLLNTACSLHSHALGAHIENELMAGMPKARDDSPCTQTKDAGPRADVEALRRMMDGQRVLVPSVVVSGNWAMGEWYGGGGGESLYKFVGGAWRRVADGGGAIGVEELRRLGVPKADDCKFAIYDAKCP